MSYGVFATNKDVLPAAVKPAVRELTGVAPPLSRTHSWLVTCAIMFFGARESSPESHVVLVVSFQSLSLTFMIWMLLKISG